MHILPLVSFMCLCYAMLFYELQLEIPSVKSCVFRGCNEIFFDPRRFVCFKLKIQMQNRLWLKDWKILIVVWCGYSF